MRNSRKLALSVLLVVVAASIGFGLVLFVTKITISPREDLTKRNTIVEDEGPRKNLVVERIEDISHTDLSRVIMVDENEKNGGARFSVIASRFQSSKIKMGDKVEAVNVHYFLNSNFLIYEDIFVLKE